MQLAQEIVESLGSWQSVKKRRKLLRGLLLLPSTGRRHAEIMNGICCCFANALPDKFIHNLMVRSVIGLMSALLSTSQPRHEPIKSGKACAFDTSSSV